MEHHSISYILGMVCGFAAGFLLVFVLSRLIRKVGGKICTFKCAREGAYDERQLQARGKAYKVGFFFLILYVTIVSVLNDMCNIPLLMSFGGMWIGICIAIFIFATICIWEDAYMSLQENAKGINIMFLLAGVVNLIAGIVDVREGVSFLEKGAVSYRYTNLIVAVLFLALTLMFNLKLLYNRKQEENEE